MTRNPYQPPEPEEKKPAKSQLAATAFIVVWLLWLVVFAFLFVAIRFRLVSID